MFLLWFPLKPLQCPEQKIPRKDIHAAPNTFGEQKAPPECANEQRPSGHRPTDLFGLHGWDRAFNGSGDMANLNAITRDESLGPRSFSPSKNDIQLCHALFPGTVFHKLSHPNRR